jgi:hypothetical protein
MTDIEDDPTPGTTGVDAGGWPTAIAAGELIESSWGNAVVTGFGKVHVNGGYANRPVAVMAATGTALSVTVPAVAYATTMYVTGTIWIGNDTGVQPGCAATCLTTAGANSTGNPAVSTPAGGAFVPLPVIWRWAVAAGASPNYVLTAYWAAAGGTIYVSADTIWHQYRS